MKFKALGLAVVAAVLLTMPAWTHHSHGNYQMTEYIQMEGTVQQIHWINPHSRQCVQTPRDWLGWCSLLLSRQSRRL